VAQVLNGLPHSVAGDAERLSKLRLCWQEAANRVLAACDAVAERLGELDIKGQTGVIGRAS
jgi:hypothetical protein